MSPTLAEEIDALYSKAWSPHARALIAFGLSEVAVLCAEATCRPPITKDCDVPRALRIVSLIRSSAHNIPTNQNLAYRAHLGVWAMTDWAVRDWGHGGHSNAIVLSQAFGAVQSAPRHQSAMSFHSAWYSAQRAAEEAERLGADLQAARLHLVTLRELLGERAG
jgi:hypothetical protein